MAKNYNEYLTVDDVNKSGTRVTKVVPTDYGYRVQMFNSYVTLHYLKIVVNENKSAKIHWRIEKNYHPVERYTSYYDCDGNVISLKEYKLIKTSQIMKTVSELEVDLKTATADLFAMRRDTNKDIDLFDKKVAEVRELEKQIKHAKLVERVTAVNKRDKIHRELLVEFLEVGAIDRNLLTDHGKLHKNKRKGNEKLYDFVEKHGVYFGFEMHDIIVANVNVGHQRFILQNTYNSYKSGGRVFKSFESLAEACEFKGILLKDLSIAEAKKKLSAIDKATAKFKKALADYDKELSDNNRYFYETEKFLNRYALHGYEYTSQF